MYRSSSSSCSLELSVLELASDAAGLVNTADAVAVKFGNDCQLVLSIGAQLWESRREQKTYL